MIESEKDQVAVLDLETHEKKILVQGGSNARYAAGEHIVYAAAGTLRAVSFDARRLEIRGNPVPVAEHVVMKQTARPISAFRATDRWPTSAVIFRET